MPETASWAETVDGVVITLTGELDLATADAVHAATAEVFAVPRTGPVRVDLAGVPFLDSTGLSALIGLYRAALATGVPIILVDPAPFTVSLLAITGLTHLFTVEVSASGTPEPLG